jgi:nucleoside diphosphate kinase
VKAHVLARAHFHRVWRALCRAGFEVAAVRMLALGADGCEAGLDGGAAPAAGSLTAVLRGAGAPGAAAPPDRAAEPEAGCEGVCAVFALRRPAALRLLRELAGPASPARAKREGAFTLRAMFGVDDGCNAVLLPADETAAAAALALAFPADARALAPTPAAAAGRARADDALVPRTLAAAPTRRLVRVRAATLCEVVLVAIPCAPLAADAELVPATLLDAVLAERFEVCAVRVAQLSEAQAARLLARARAPALAPRALSAGPCVLVALQRDNAIARFASLLKGPLRMLAPPHAYASASAAAAAADLADAFDQLYGARDSAFEAEPLSVMPEI